MRRIKDDELGLLKRVQAGADIDSAAAAIEMSASRRDFIVRKWTEAKMIDADHNLTAKGEVAFSRLPERTGHFQAQAEAAALSEGGSSALTETLESGSLSRQDEAGVDDQLDDRADRDDPLED